MALYFLVRHALPDLPCPMISGRGPGLPLSAEGHRQAQALAGYLAGQELTAIYTSPMERTRETAVPLAERLGLVAHPTPELNELDYGDWTGRRLSELEGAPGWREWNTFRTGTRIPGGETILEVQARAVGWLLARATAAPEERAAVFSHGDVIRAVLAVFLGMPTDLSLRLEIAPASVSLLELNSWGPRVLGVNHVPGAE